MRGGHVGDAVQQAADVASQAGVPGVGVDNFGVTQRVRHAQSGGEGLDGTVGLGKLRIYAVDVDILLLARPAHAVHVHVLELPHVTNQLGDVHAGTTVNLWGIFLCQHGDTHASRLTARGATCPGNQTGCS